MFKYLGLVIDRKLTWRDQANHVSTKATKILNLLRRNLHHATKSAKSRAFSALVRPHLEYSAPVWSPHTKTAISKLENVQKRAARWIEAKWSKSDHCWNRFYEDCRHSTVLANFGKPASPPHMLSNVQDLQPSRLHKPQRTLHAIPMQNDKITRPVAPRSASRQE